MSASCSSGSGSRKRALHAAPHPAHHRQGVSVGGGLSERFRLRRAGRRPPIATPRAGRWHALRVSPLRRARPGSRDLRGRRPGIGWFLAGYVGVAGFLGLEATTREGGAASSLDASSDDQGTTRTILATYAVALSLAPMLRRVRSPQLPHVAGRVGLALETATIAFDHRSAIERPVTGGWGRLSGRSTRPLMDLGLLPRSPAVREQLLAEADKLRRALAALDPWHDLFPSAKENVRIVVSGVRTNRLGFRVRVGELLRCRLSCFAVASVLRSSSSSVLTVSSISRPAGPR
jgi:hypothetical protein